MPTQRKKHKSNDSIQILIADDHGVLRAGLCALLNAEPGLEVTGEATNAEETLRLAHKLRPDILLLDISMPGSSGIEITRELKKAQPDTSVLILTIHEEESLLQKAIHAGASGYVTKRAIKTELINAIHAVQRGDLYVHPTMTRALMEDQSSSPADDGLIEPLTPRETEVLRLIALGHTNRQTANLLNISVRTAESHRANIMGKLNAHGRVELVRYAIDHDLLER